MVMKIRCTACGSAKFAFTDIEGGGTIFHGARCRHCNKRLTARDLLPNTRTESVTYNLKDTGDQSVNKGT